PSQSATQPSIGGAGWRHWSRGSSAARRPDPRPSHPSTGQLVERTLRGGVVPLCAFFIITHRFGVVRGSRSSKLNPETLIDTTPGFAEAAPPSSSPAAGAACPAWGRPRTNRAMARIPRRTRTAGEVTEVLVGEPPRRVQH